jgi:5-methylcytosine-specific restriction enzyme subunit McrC
LIGGDDGLGFSLLFEMNKLFEEFIGRSVRIALKNSGLGVTLQGPQSYALSEIGTNQPRFMTQPDIIIHSDGRPVMVIDTKWKRLGAPSDDSRHGVSPSDVYQMMAYAQVYRVKQLMLLYPHHSQLEQKEGLVKKYAIIGAGDVRLSVATVSLLDLQRITSQLKSLVAASGLPT